MPRGGARKGAGRPSGKPLTKATIYREDRELLKEQACRFGISVNELIHRVFRSKNIDIIYSSLDFDQKI